MGDAVDGIFDMVRTICTLTGIKVVFDTAYVAWEELFTDPCPRCMGAGTMTCPYCKGTKTLRARPTRLVRGPKQKTTMLLHLARDVDECWFCGPTSRLDFDMDSEDINDESDTLAIMENFDAAIAGRKLPHTECLAGTVPCELCMGSRILHRFTPNFSKVFGSTDDIWTKIASKAGFPTDNLNAVEAQCFRKDSTVSAFVEYPSHPEPLTIEWWAYTWPRRVHPILTDRDAEEAEGSETTRDEQSPFKFVLPQLDQDDELELGDALAFP